jgi:hypothetical protein
MKNIILISIIQLKTTYIHELVYITMTKAIKSPQKPLIDSYKPNFCSFSDEDSILDTGEKRFWGIVFLSLNLIGLLT